jgi:hypothetical protein
MRRGELIEDKSECVSVSPHRPVTKSQYILILCRMFAK